ncbi:MAG: histidine phosphatase family protein [Bacteroidota bacterium]
MTDKTIYIIRHGQTEFNKQHIIQGSGVDSSLNDTGQAQAKAFFRHYEEVSFDAVLVSGLIRTQQTVQPFIDKGLPWEKWNEINEIGWGIHEGQKSEPWMVESYKQTIAAWGRGEFDASVEQGESAAKLAARLGTFVEHIKNRPEKQLLVCSHGRAMRCLMCVLQRQHLREMENYKHANTGLYKVDFQNGIFNIVLANDTRHLNDLKQTTGV